MRTVKFRGRCAFSGTWRFGFYYVSKGNHIIRDEKDRESIVLEDSVGQFSGLNDKNGKAVFDGDIIKKCGYNKNERQWIKYYRVIYEYDAFCLEKDGETYAFGFSKDGKLIKEEIVGNIHENPSLLNP